MTGGQDVTGALPIPDLTRQLEAQGLKRVVVLTEAPERYRGQAGLASNAEVRHRDDLEAVMRELVKTPGAKNEVPALSVSMFARLDAAENDPASITYEDGAPPAALQFRVTSEPLTMKLSPVGDGAAPPHPHGCCDGTPTFTTTSFEAAVGTPFTIARMRT